MGWGGEGEERRRTAATTTCVPPLQVRCTSCFRWRSCRKSCGAMCSPFCRYGIFPALGRPRWRGVSSLVRAGPLVCLFAPLPPPSLFLPLPLPLPLLCTECSLLYHISWIRVLRGCRAPMLLGNSHCCGAALSCVHFSWCDGGAAQSLRSHEGSVRPGVKALLQAFPGLRVLDLGVFWFYYFFVLLWGRNRV